MTPTDKDKIAELAAIAKCEWLYGNRRKSIEIEMVLAMIKDQFSWFYRADNE